MLNIPDVGQSEAAPGVEPASRPAAAAPKLMLRDYQQAMVDRVFDAWARARRGGGKVVLYGPTGSGKTAVAAGIMMRDWLAKPSRRWLFAVERTSLLRQSEERFLQYGLPVGVVHARRDDLDCAPIIISTEQTMERRYADGGLPRFDGIIIDEAHRHYRRFVRMAAARTVFGSAKMLGLTATPFPVHMGRWDALVNVVEASTNRLVERGLLVLPEFHIRDMFTASQLESGLARSSAGGEWTDGSVARMFGPKIEEIAKAAADVFRDVVDPRILVYGATCLHASSVGAALADAMGWPRSWVHPFFQDTSQSDRDRHLRDFEDNPQRILCSVEALGVGFDSAAANCALLARPFSASQSSHLQQVGRVMRPCRGKDRAVIVDVSGNEERMKHFRQAVYEDGVEGLPKEHDQQKGTWECRGDEADPDDHGCGYDENPWSTFKCRGCGRARRPKRIDRTSCGECGHENFPSDKVCRGCSRLIPAAHTNTCPEHERVLIAVCLDCEDVGKIVSGNFRCFRKYCGGKACEERCPQAGCDYVFVPEEDSRAAMSQKVARAVKERREEKERKALAAAEEARRQAGRFCAKCGGTSLRIDLTCTTCDPPPRREVTPQERGFLRVKPAYCDCGHWRRVTKAPGVGNVGGTTGCVDCRRPDGGKCGCAPDRLGDVVMRTGIYTQRGKPTHAWYRQGPVPGSGGRAARSSKPPTSGKGEESWPF